MYTIIYSSSRADFSEIPLGDFFMLGGQLYFKYSCTHAFNLHQKSPREFEQWNDVETAEVSIKVN